MTKVLSRMNGQNSSISSAVGGFSGTSCVGKRGGGRGSSHGNVQSKVRRNVYSDTPHVRVRHLNLIVCL